MIRHVKGNLKVFPRRHGIMEYFTGQYCARVVALHFLVEVYTHSQKYESLVSLLFFFFFPPPLVQFSFISCICRHSHKLLMGYFIHNASLLSDFLRKM